MRTHATYYYIENLIVSDEHAWKPTLIMLNTSRWGPPSRWTVPSSFPFMVVVLPSLLFAFLMEKLE